SFDLTTQTAALLAGNATTPVSTYTVKFYQDAALTQLISNPTSFTNTTVNQQTIYVQVTNNQTGCKSAVG
ncbi:hypothetical protein, partial [Flavobacterium sp. XGLA_31]|uniref:hypothetical protein n=1 Tax=Flavobacterium sp. XGLA_31 TaxID=3447666 RepID=UPI003F400E1C